MAFQALTVLASMNSSVFGLWRSFNGVKIFCFIMVLSCAIFSFMTCEPLSIDGKHELEENDGCRCYGDNSNTVFQDFSSEYENPRTHINIDSICADSHAFCFPSTLPGFFSGDQEVDTSTFEDSGSQFDGSLTLGSDEETGTRRNKTWSVDYGMFKLLNGGVVSCSLNLRDGTDKLSSIQTDSAVQNDLSSCRGPLVNQKISGSKEETNVEMNESDSSYSSSSHDVEINPEVLDWGYKYTYFPSAAFLTVANTCNDSMLHVYEPFSTDSQFFPCNFSEALLGPGETISICFVFLPRWLGSSSAHLVLQTSSGGFLIQAKGFAIESPYEIHKFLGHSATSGIPGRRWNGNLSLSNSLDETLYIEEITAWISISVGHTSIDAEAICRTGLFQDSEVRDSQSIEDWLVVRNDQFGLPLFGMRPCKNWEIAPYSTETIMEVDFDVGSKGKVYGAFCMKLFRSSKENFDTVVVPLEAELDGKIVRSVSESISVSLELYPYDAGEAVVAISLRNDAPHLLSVVKITKVADIKVLQIKYIERLLLYPGSETKVAVFSCSDMPDSAPKVPNMYGNCKLVVLTNDSTSLPIEVSCQEIVQICFRNLKDSLNGYKRSKTVSPGNVARLPSHIKALEGSEADEFVLENWKSQGTTGGLSVLDADELFFPMVQVGSHQSKWITVRNPSEKPVVMQLIMNSGEIIDECKGTDGLIQPPSSGSMVHDDSTTPSRYGFSIADGAIKEAYVQPYHSTLFGPILFHPSNRCEWRSSALVRNNLSGVEWVSLRGFGGSLSLLLHEVSEPVVRNIEFNLSLPIPLHVENFVQMEEAISCSQPVLKELYAKNTGDLPLEVLKIKVSGKDCGLDGFKVHTCTGFAIEPGEFSKVLISYQTDFSSSLVQRDLELVLATGILVIPMKAILSVHMLNVCKRSLFWFRVKRYAITIAPVAFLILLVFCFLFPQVLSFSSHDCLGRNCKGSMPTTSRTDKCTRGLNLGNCKFSLLPERENLTDKMAAQTCVGNYTGHQVVLPDQGTQYVKQAADKHKRASEFLESQRERELLTSLVSQSVKIDNPDTHEPSQPTNLTIQTEKGRRRRKKKAGGSKLVGLFEVSSSHSGNSTPSSPLSPLTSVTPRQMWLQSHDADQAVDCRNSDTLLGNQRPQMKEFAVKESVADANLLTSKVIMEHQRQNSLSPQKRNSLASTQEQPSAFQPIKPATHKSLLPSATFPSSGRRAQGMRFSSPILASSSTIDLHARAPGSKLCDQRNTKSEEKTLLVDEDRYTYDIWGDHFSRLHLMGSSNNMSKNPENYSDSFFVKGPQALMTNSAPKSKSYFRREG